MGKFYNITKIRALLIEGFNDDELIRFGCDDLALGPVQDRLAQWDKEKIVDLLLYVLREERFYILLDWAEKQNPTAYAKYQPYYYEENEPLIEAHFISSSHYSRLRLDAAVPDRVIVGRVFDLAVAVRQPSSPILSEGDLKRVKSGEVQVEWPASEPYVRLRMQVQAAECEIQGSDAQSFRLYRDQDSPIFYFQLVPQQSGSITIVVIVYQEEDWLGSTRVHTVGHKKAAGKVKVNVKSETIEINETESLRKQLLQRHLNLLKLNEQAAIYGAGQTPLYLLNQIEAEQKAVEEIEARLAELRSVQE